MQRRDPLLGLGGLTTLLGLLVFGWVVRQPPYETADCGISGPAQVREAWLVGLAPAAFVTACGCACVALWASAGMSGRGRPRTLSSILAAIVLTLGLNWWIAGVDSPVAFWVVIAWFGLFPSVLLVPTLASLVWWTARKRSDVWAWRWLRLLSWWSMLVLVPAFVGTISSWGDDFYC